jgi:hypothetical protein
MPLNPQVTFTSSKIRPLNPEQARTIAVRLPAGVTYSAGQVLEEVNLAAQNEVQTITLGGTPAGGSFTLVYPSARGFDHAGPIAWSATGATLAANIQAALDAEFGTGQTVVTGTGPFTVTYSGSEVSNRDMAMPTVINNLTGTSPTVTLATSTPGSAGIVGCYQAYASGNARAVLEGNVRTDAMGNIIDEFGNTNAFTAVAFNKGFFLASDIVGLDATAVPTDGTAGTLGKLKSGASIATSGAIIEIL